MGRPTLKLEIPLPRWPSSPRARFSMRTLLAAVTAMAVGLAIYTHARNRERAQHDGGYFQLVVSAPDMMRSTTLCCANHQTVFELVRSPEFGLRSRSDVDPKELWPPKVWVTRVEWGDAELEETITVGCAGTPDKPLIDPSISIKPGDRVFFDFGRRRMGNATGTVPSQSQP